MDGFVATLRALREDEAWRLAMGERARKAFEAEWNKPIALAKWRGVIEEVTGR